jgi:2-keto-myo-inositol isomerase
MRYNTPKAWRLSYDWKQERSREVLLGFNGATTMKADLAGDIQAAGAAGFRALEIWAAKMDRFLEKQTVPDLKALFDRHRVRPVSINSIEFITFRPPEEYAGIQARLRQLCEVCAGLGCDKIVVVPSPLPKTGAGREAVKAESVKVLRDLAGIAAPFGVSLAFEFLGFGWCSVRTLEACWEIVAETGRDNVGLVIDTCHFYAGGSSLAAIERTDPRKIFIFHINDVEERPKETIEDARRLLPGEGVIPLADILERLHRIGFDGLCSIELFRPAYWERDPAELARAAHAATRKVLAPYFKVG